jgi:KUP system potassium uptake protein
MMTWKDGRACSTRKLRADAIDLPSFLEAVFVSPPARVEGTAVFLTAERGHRAQCHAAQPQAQQGAA